MTKLGEVDSHLASMHQKVDTTCQGEAQTISNAKVEITKLEKNFQAEI